MTSHKAPSGASLHTSGDYQYTRTNPLIPDYKVVAMTSASTQAKVAGLKSLAEVSKLTGIHVVTLERWAQNKPDLFEIVLLGCLAKNKELNKTQEVSII